MTLSALPRSEYVVPGCRGALRGIPTYRAGSENRCPACARSHWLVGRATAECAFCGTALPLAFGAPPTFRFLLRAV